MEVMADYEGRAPHVMIVFEFDKLDATGAEKIVRNLKFDEHIELHRTAGFLTVDPTVDRNGFGLHAEKGKLAVVLHYQVHPSFLANTDPSRSYDPGHHGKAVEAIKADSNKIIKTLERALGAFDS
ncbi:MAG: hypothetical protein ABR865_09960 [Terracidiphilus sp.]